MTTQLKTIYPFKMKRNFFYTLSLLALTFNITSCKDEALPKPKAYLALEYPEAAYQKFDNASNYQFNYNSLGKITNKGNNSFHIEYPRLKATVFLNYRPVQNNIDILLRDAQKLTYEHVVKADNITEQPFINNKERKFGMFYEVGGNAASQSQFYVTDSTKNFLMGSIYFYAKPNFDSVLPAAQYIKNDLRILMESLKWK